MRLFLAIHPDEHTIQQIQRLYENIPDYDTYLARVRPENMHITVRFLGEVRDDKVDELQNELYKQLKQAEAFSVETDKVMVGLSGDRLYLEVIPNEKLLNVREIASRAIEFTGIPLINTYETFTPHISISRANNNLSQEEKSKLINGIKGTSIHSNFNVRSINLIKSELTHDGPIYTTLFTFPLNPI